MGFQDAIKKGIEIAKLNRETCREVASNPEAFTQGLIITVLAGVAMWLSPASFTPWGILRYPLFAVLGLFIGGGILHFIAILLGGQGDYMALIRVLGVGRVVGWIRIIPWLGTVVDLVWSLVIAVVVMEELYGLDRFKAVLCVLIPFAVIAALGFIMIVVAGLATLGTFFFLG